MNRDLEARLDAWGKTLRAEDQSPELLAACARIGRLLAGEPR